MLFNFRVALILCFLLTKQSLLYTITIWDSKTQSVLDVTLFCLFFWKHTVSYHPQNSVTLNPVCFYMWWQESN